MSNQVMYKVKNKRTGHSTVVHMSASIATRKKAIETAIYWYKDELTKYNTKANWKVVNYSSSNRFEMQDDF